MSRRSITVDIEEGPPAPPSGKLHTCDGCGKTEIWGTTWGWYGSYRDLDDGAQVFRSCSPACQSMREETTERRRIAADIEAAKTDEQRREDELARRRQWRKDAEAERGKQ